MRGKSSHWAAALPAAASFLALLCLIADAGRAASAAREGISMCLQTVVPSLFPFLVAARMFTGSAAAGWCARVLGPWMEPVFHLPAESATALVLGVLSGYPVGAQSAAQLHQSGRLTREEAERLLGFCSNAGPAFIFGVLGSILGSMKTAAVLYAIHVLSAVLTGIILRQRQRERLHSPAALPRVSSEENLSQGVAGAVRTMGLICGYIVLFQVLAAFLDRLTGTWTPPVIRLALSGLLEMTSGICRLPSLDAAGLRYCMASGFLAFGGLCVWLQTSAVIRPAGLTGKYYLFGKTLQGTIAVLLTWAVQVMLPALLPRAVPASEIPLPNHAGLLKATGMVTGIFLLLLGIWCVQLQKRAGKQKAVDV